MVYRPNIDEQLCFVLMPFQELHQEYFKGIISPAAETLGLKARKADDIYGTAPIIQDIWHSIWAAKVVIADVTGRNPNVNYELGLCHAIGVPTVLITQHMDDVPFDYRHRRCIVYDTRRIDWQDKLRQDITLTLKTVLDSKETVDELAWPYDTKAPRNSRRTGLFVPAEEAATSILQGISVGRDAIARAFGPHGTTLSVSSLARGGNSDRGGAQIASALDAIDPLEQRGLEQVRAVAREMSSQLGDGTKAAVLLFHGMVSGGLAALQTGAVLRDLVHDMDVAIEAAVQYLEKNSRAAGPEQLLAVAQTAAVGDRATGRIVHEAIARTGADGVVYIEDSLDIDTTLDVREGMYFDCGFVTPRFITDEPKQLAVLTNAHILLYPGKLSSMRSLLPVLEQVAQAKKSLLVVADDIEGEALETLVANHVRGTLLSVAVRSPGFNERQAILEDIAVATGGSVASSSGSLESVSVSQLGSVDRVEVSKHSTWLIGGKAKQELLQSRAAGIRQQISVSGTDYDIEKLRERLAKLVGRISAIRVGGVSSLDRSDRKYRLQTALHSTQAAIAGGMLPGGGIALWRAREVVSKATNAGASLISDALTAPLEVQLGNSRASSKSVLAELEEARNIAIGFNAEKRAVSNLVEDGILDATRVVVRGLQVAFTHARTVLQTGAWDISDRAQLPSSPSDETF